MAVVRPYERADLQACTDLFIRVFSQPPWNDRWPSTDVARAYLEDYVRAPGFDGFVAEERGQVLGFLLGHRRQWWSGPEFYIDEFGIDPDRQRQGIGTTLLDHLKHVLSTAGVHTITLLTARDSPAASFYAGLGFRAHERMVFMSHRIAVQDAQ
jgi:aminoglycoside 6'-N-acetyltransferase I